MSRDKQTEIMELARELCGEGEQHEDCFHCPTLRCCGVQKFARELYNKGWRKSADVAEEIFEEIEAIIRKHDERPKYQLMLDLAELKKKYTKESEGENHDGN